MQYLFFPLEFILSIFLAFFIPGRVSLGKINLPLIPKTIVSFVIGIVLWALQGLLFGYLQIRWFSYLYLLIFFILYFKESYLKEFIYKRKWKIDLPAFLIITIGVIGQVFPYIRTGWETSQGVIIAAHNSEDHIWHAALVKELIKRFPPNEPAISGVVLKDYHYFYNLVTADLIRVFHLPFFFTQFDGMYILAPVFFGIIAYYLAQKIWNSKTFIWLFLFFIYFSGDASGWFMLLFHNNFNWSLSSLINDASKFMDSPPYGYAIIIGLTGFYLLINFSENLPKRLIILCALLFGCLLEWKIYVGIPFLIAYGVYGAGFLLKRKIEPFISFIFAGILSFTLLKLGSSSSAGLIFLPVDIPRDFINQPLLQLKDWQLRWVIFQDHHNIIRLIQYGAMMAGVYLLIQFGIQLLGIFSFFQIFKKLGKENGLFFYTGTLSAFILGLFFYQTVGGANIWEFFLAAAPLLSFLTALSVALLIEKFPRFVQALIILIIVILVIPQWFISMQTYIREEYLRGFHGVSKEQLASYYYLNTHIPSDSIIFLANQSNYSYASVINLFVDHDLYLSGNGVRQIVTTEMTKRRSEVDLVSSGINSTDISSMLRIEGITYLYFYGKPSHPDVLGHANMQMVFANNAATIYTYK